MALDRSVRSISSSLRAIGIDRDSDGLFTVDTDDLEEAIAEDPDAVMRRLSPMAIAAQRITQDFLSAPATYATDPQNPVAASALKWMQYHDMRGMLINTVF